MRTLPDSSWSFTGPTRPHNSPPDPTIAHADHFPSDTRTASAHPAREPLPLFQMLHWQRAALHRTAPGPPDPTKPVPEPSSFHETAPDDTRPRQAPPRGHPASDDRTASTLPDTMTASAPVGASLLCTALHFTARRQPDRAAPHGALPVARALPDPSPVLLLETSAHTSRC